MATIVLAGVVRISFARLLSGKYRCPDFILSLCCSIRMLYSCIKPSYGDGLYLAKFHTVVAALVAALLLPSAHKCFHNLPSHRITVFFVFSFTYVFFMSVEILSMKILLDVMFSLK